MSQISRCWCGNTDLVAFSDVYFRCVACETLVLAQMPNAQNLQVVDDARDFYGQSYYQTHLVEDYGYPALEDRARDDLPKRGLHWLQTLLRRKQPPGKALELGSAHGGFVALMRWAGFDAVGLELSPSIVAYARQTFDIPTLLGPVERQQIEPHSLDVIALMDV